MADAGFNKLIAFMFDHPPINARISFFRWPRRKLPIFFRHDWAVPSFYGLRGAKLDF